VPANCERGLLRSELFSELEYRRLVLAIVEGSDGATEDQIANWIRWAEQAMVDNTLLQMVLSETLLPHYDAETEDFIFKPKGSTN
jgi:hypothetical protein